MPDPNLPFRLGGFGAILADPPWEYTAGKATRIKPPYPTMTTDAICALPIAGLASERSLLFCWATQNFTEEGYRVVRAWGFRPVAQMIWVKTCNSDPRRPKIGMGSYVRNAHELVIIGSHGGQTGLARDVPSVFFGPRGDHSAKPDEIYSIVERLAPGPRLELFARRRRPGWRSWGNELPALRQGAR